ncbi:MAG TPA: response regulator [Rhizomicrobium sp.]
MEMVLVVESEALIRMSAVHIVQDAGFATLDAGNADEAIAMLESRGDIRAVFTDINMTGSMNGLRLAHAIRGRWPPIHLIVASGRKVPAEGELPANGRFILKPYTPEHVAAVLRELFGSQPAPDRIGGDSGQNCSKVA